MTNVLGGSSDASRGTYCTPKWLADLIGSVSCDPCSNPRSHIHARFRAMLEDGGDGLDGEALSGWLRIGSPDGFPPRYQHIPTEWKVFVNPPYGRGHVIKWVRQWRAHRFIFLLKWDPSTAWFRELLPHCTHVWFPDERIDFEPPPGIKATDNPFPHALYLRDPSPDLLDRLSARGYVFRVDVGASKPQDVSREGNADHEDGGTDRDPPSGVGEGERGTPGAPGGRDGPGNRVVTGPQLDLVLDGFFVDECPSYTLR